MRSLLLTVWTVSLALLVLIALIGTLTTPTAQQGLSLSSEDLKLQLLVLPPSETQGLISANLEDEVRDDYDSVYRAAQRDPDNSKLDLTPVRLKLGLLYAETKRLDRALPLWQGQGDGGKVLAQLYQVPPRPLPQSEATLRQNLKGWYLATGLERLYRAEGRPLTELRQAQVTVARKTLDRFRWSERIQGGLLLLGLLVLGREAVLWGRGQRAWGAKWALPWTLEDAIAVVVGWLTVLFFVAPLLLSGLERPLANLEPDLAAALRVFGGKGVDLTGGLLLLWYLILRPYRFWETFNIRLKGLSWGIGGYLAAYPAVLAMAALTEQLVAGGGGGNSVLSAIAESTNPLAQGLFLVTVVGLAPIFEEILFRGLLFPSLTTVMTVPQGIFLSGIIFGAIHTSAAEFLPLSVLGMILAYSYQQTRNLAVPILIHMLFNGVTFGALLVLGGA